MDRFPLTRLSVVERIRAEDLEVRRVAFSDLVAGYWKPVYKRLRLTWRLSAEDAQDLTQGFSGKILLLVRQGSLQTRLRRSRGA